MTDIRFAREQALVLARELERRQSQDPLRLFQPHAKQRAFIESVLHRQKPENWFIAANRSGKSDAGAFVGATLARFGFPATPGPTAGWVSALDFATSRDVLQPKYFNNGFVPPGQPHAPFIPDHEIKSWRVEDQILTLKNGSVVGFKSAESGRSKYQGSERDWFHADEEHPFEIYEEAVIRVGSRPLAFFCTATILPPEGQTRIANSWVYEKVIRAVQSGKVKHIGLFGASIYDNPGIPREDIERLEAIYPLGSPSRRIRLDGEWLPGIGGSRAYTSFSHELHVVEPPGIATRRPLVWTWDFNVEPMCSLVGQYFDNCYWVFSEFVLEEGNVPEMCDAFRREYPQHEGGIMVYGDATSQRRTGQTGKSDYYVILQEMANYRSPVRLMLPEVNPRVPDRINAVNRLLLNEKKEVQLKVSPECTELIADFENVRRDNKGGILKTMKRKDPYFRRTHTSDALGYWLAFEEPVRAPSNPMRNYRVKPAGYGFSKHR